MTSYSKDLPPLPPNEGPSAPSDQPLKHPGLFKRLTTKLRKPESWATDGPEQPQDGARTHRRRRTDPSAARPHNTPNLENSFTSPEQRAAALRACGLLPAQAQPLHDAHGYHLPLSEQEAQLDSQRAITVEAPGGARGSEAERIAEAWMKKNRGAGSQSPSPSNERASGETSIGEVQVSTAPPVARPQGRENGANPRPAFLEREPQAAKLLDAMKNHRPPIAAQRRRYPNGSDSDTDSDSD